MPIKKVFLSSTARDLKEYREAAYGAIEGLDGYHCVRMEDFGARDWDADEFCRAKVGECDLFVGIVGHLYGSCPGGSEKSYTEREYDAAVGSEIPRLMFVATDEVSLRQSLRESDKIYEKQQAFRKRVDTERKRDSFESPEDLSGKIRQAIHNWEREHPKKSVQTRTTYVPFLAPPLPEHFVPRPEKSEEVKRRLLTNTLDRPGVLVVSALHGLGGIGKTVLAASIAHDKEVINRFSDGVLWATLGKEPDLLSLLSGWIQALGDYEFRPTTPEAASMHLSTLLHDKTAILVVDDAWNSAHVQPFRIGGPRCSLLVTTRDSLIAEAVGAKVYDLDVMTKSQSLALLSNRLGHDLGETERQEALDLAKEVGYLPLALNLIAAQIEDGVSWTELLEELRAEIARLEALEKPGVEELDEATRRNLSLRASFQLSVQSLPEKKRIAFAWLGVLPEDVLLAPRMATTLWGVDLRSAGETLRYLRSKALVLPGPYLDDVQTYRVHDLLHDFALNLIVASPTSKNVNAPGLGLTVQEAHSSLLKRYRVQSRDGLWYTLPYDGYIHNNLLWHMQKAGWIDEINALFREENPEGKNGWYQVRECFGQTKGFLEDVVQAWELASFGSAYNKNKISVCNEIRYALITASINSLSANIPPELLAALVKKGIWSPIQALAYARQVPDLWIQPKSLVASVPYLDEQLKIFVLEEALNISRDIRDGDLRAELLVYLAPYLSDELLNKALIIARDINNDFFKFEALSGLLPYLSITLKNVVLTELLIISKNIGSDLRESALSELVPRIAELGNIEEALKMMDDLKELDIRIEVLSKLAYYLSETQMENMFKDALNSAMNTKNLDSKAEMLLLLLPFLEDQLKEKVVYEVLLTAQNINNVSQRVHVLTGLLVHLSGFMRSEVLNDVLVLYEKIENLESKVEQLADLIPYLSEPFRERLISDALASTKDIYDELSRARSVAYLVPFLSEPLLLKALTIVQKIRNDYQNWVLGEFALKLAKIGKPDNAIRLALEIEEIGYETRAMIRLIPYLKEPTKGEMIETTFDISRKIQNKYERAYLLSELAPYLQDSLREDVLMETLKIARELQQESEKVSLLEGLAFKLPNSLICEAINLAEDIKNKNSMEIVLAELLPMLADSGYKESLLNKILRIESEKARSVAIVKIAPFLSKPQIKSILSDAEKIKDYGYRSRVMVGLSSYISDPLKKNEVIRDGWKTIQKIDPDRFEIDIVAEIISNLPDYLLDEALEITRSIRDDGSRGFLLAKLARRFSEPLKKELLIEALFSARRDQWEVEYESYRPAAFTELAPELSEFPADILYPLWNETLHILARHKRDDLLGDLLALTPVILALGGQEALMETARAIQDVGRWWP